MKTSRFLDRVQPSATLAISNKAATLKAEGRDVIGFGAGEPDFNTPDPIIETAKRALDKGRTKYAPVSGTNELRQAIATWYNARYHTQVAAENVIVSVGGKHSLYNVARALLDPGDKVLIPAPYWVSYPAQVELCGADPVFLETREEDGFVVTPETLDRALTEHAPRYVIFNSPSNPTGMAIGRDPLAQLLEVFRRHPDVLLVWDSIYEQLVYDGFEHVEPLQLAPDLADRIVVTSGFSKSYAMTGWRLGYAIAPVKLVKAMSKLQSHCTSGPTTFAMDGAVAALQLEQAAVDAMVKIFDERRRRMVELLRAIPDVTVPMPQGAFYAFCNLSAYLGASWEGRTLDDDLAIADYLLEKGGVAVVPGSAFGAPGFARLSYACSLENIEKGVTRMGEALRALRG